jgi:sugar phosphate isomerase/epimerase
VFAYHNHAFDFALENGKPGLDVLYESSDPQAVQAQIDTYWVAYGGSDPAAYIRKLRGRVPLVHLKDGTLGGDKPVFLEPGEGELDWSNILAACEESGVEFGAIELDVCPRDPFVSARACVEFFRHAGLKD